MIFYSGNVKKPLETSVSKVNEIDAEEKMNVEGKIKLSANILKNFS